MVGSLNHHDLYDHRQLCLSARGMGETRDQWPFCLGHPFDLLCHPAREYYPSSLSRMGLAGFVDNDQATVRLLVLLTVAITLVTPAAASFFSACACLIFFVIGYLQYQTYRLTNVRQFLDDFFIAMAIGIVFGTLAVAALAIGGGQ
jgi:hypothetical protein